MKRIGLLSLCILVVTVGLAHAGAYGPVRPAAKAGQISQEIGYFFSQAKWEADKSGFKEGTTSQNQAYVQAGYGLDSNTEVYFRVGGADLDFEGDLEGIGLFANQDLEMDGGIQPFVSVGARGLLHRGALFDFGLFAQASYCFPYKDDRSYTLFGFSVEEEVEVKDIWDVSVGAALQVDLAGAAVYLGPVLYYGQADVDTETVLEGLEDSSSSRYEEKGNIGAVAGISIPVADFGSVRLEGQYKSKVSGGGAFVYLRLNR